MKIANLDINYPKSEQTLKRNKYLYKGIKFINDMGHPCEYRLEKDGKDLKDRVLSSMNELINAQMNLAQGCQMLFVIHTNKDSKGKTTRDKPELITDQYTIEKYLAGELTDDEGNRNEDDDENYYFITTNKPDNKALDSLIDRVFGKSTQRTELTGKDGEDLKVIAGFNYINLDDKDNSNNKTPTETGQSVGEAS